MRQAIATKKYYPNGSSLLDKEFEKLFTQHKKGPGALPAKKLVHEGDPIKALIVSHAPYTVAGACMAWAYKALIEQKQDSDLYIIIAQAQNSTESGTTMETFQTPYGEVRVDQEFTRELVKKGNAQLNNSVHASETLIEIQLPFLQFVNKGRMEKIKIVPILVNADTNIAALSIDLKETLLEQHKKATYIFVSNFTSYGRGFRYVPFTEDIPKNIAEIDKQLFTALETYDKKTFFEVVEQTMVPISGYSALELFFKLFQAKKITLEQYYLSGDITGDYSNSVSYASIILK